MSLSARGWVLGCDLAIGMLLDVVVYYCDYKVKLDEVVRRGRPLVPARLDCMHHRSALTYAQSLTLKPSLICREAGVVSHPMRLVVVLFIDGLVVEVIAEHIFCVGPSS